MSWKFRVLLLHRTNVFGCLLLLSCCPPTTFSDDMPPTQSLLQKIKRPPQSPSTAIPSSTTVSPTIPEQSTETPASSSSSWSSSPTPGESFNLPLLLSSTESVTSSTTSSSVPDICISGLRAVIATSDEEGDTVVRQEREFVHVIEGDAMLSVMTTDPVSAMFVVNRVNVANLLESDFEIGIRAISLEQLEHQAESLLLQEVEYQQQCVTHALGLFVDHDFYRSLEKIIRDLEYNVWPIPAARADLFPKVAHLLHQMPWSGEVASVEILTENLEIYNDFMAAVRSEHMCLMHFKSDHVVYILFGNKMAHQFRENGTIFAVATERTDRAFISELPDRSFVLMEREIDLRLVDQNSSQTSLDEPLLGQTVLPSRVLAFARPLFGLMRWLKDSLQQHCKRAEDLYVLATCRDFLTFIADWRGPGHRPAGHDLPQLLDLLHMRRLATLMDFQMFEKRPADDMDAAQPVVWAEDGHSGLREIAAQNFVTNVTTYFHYNRDNRTSLQLKQTKFGNVFNCQYSAGGANSRHPFLFEGESVMFWRIRPDTWVATAMTAAILGLLCAVAIFVFIAVRIWLGDVFEGNPVTTLLLLLALLLVFTSIVPFAMEYVGAQRNSHVTFEDAATLNTLCAVRVFLMTLIYCFVFSLLLSRAVMLASIGSEGGFLSHVNGYIQALICLFSVSVQLGMSVQLLVLMHTSADTVSCESIYYGHWLWALLAYDCVLLLGLVALVPFIYRSQRNYREGILIVIGSVLMLVIWVVWIGLSLFGDELRDAAIALGLQATGWALLVGVLIPRTFLIVRGIERSDIAQALPSLASLAFAQNNQYSSEQSVYECVNPAMRNCSQDELHQSPSEIPTLPLRGGGPRRQQFFANLRQANNNAALQRHGTARAQRGSPTRSEQSSLSPSPDNSKITRF